QSGMVAGPGGVARTGDWGWTKRWAAWLPAAVLALVLLAAAPARAHTPRVLLVGSYNGVKGPFRTIQAAVNVARAGDWILVGPGDYHEQGVKGASEPAGVLIRTPGIHLRGMDRNSVIVDGTKPGAAPCSPRLADQEITATGRNGIVVDKADGVYVEN